MYERLVQVLPASGEMLFTDFVVAARQAGADPAVWHRAKRAGLLHTVLINDVLYIGRGASQGGQ